MNGLSQVMRGLYSVIWIPILDPDYEYRPQKSISLVMMGCGRGPGLSVCLYSLSVYDAACLLGLVILLLRLIMQKTSPTLHLVGVVITDCREVYRLVRVFLTNSAFLCLSFYIPTSFTTDPTVVGSVVGLAPVEDPHNLQPRYVFIEHDPFCPFS